MVSLSGEPWREGAVVYLGRFFLPWLRAHGLSRLDTTTLSFLDLRCLLGSRLLSTGVDTIEFAKALVARDGEAVGGGPLFCSVVLGRQHTVGMYPVGYDCTLVYDRHVQKKKRQAITSSLERTRTLSIDPWKILCMQRWRATCRRR